MLNAVSMSFKELRGVSMGLEEGGFNEFQRVKRSFNEFQRV
jgi:hypothetical protein